MSENYPESTNCSSSDKDDLTENDDCDDLQKDFPKQESDEENKEKEQLSNLTSVQLQALINKIENLVVKCKEKIAVIQQNIEKLKSNECQVLWSSDKTELLENKQKELQDEEIFLQECKKRILFLKSIKTKHQPFPLTKLPQVVLCSPWNDKFMPMVVVCNKGKMEDDQASDLNKKFLDCLTEEQFNIIEKEKRWVALECGELAIQIAGIKGKTKILSIENDVLKAVVFEEPPGLSKVNLALPRNKNNLPCRKKGKRKEVVPCPKYTEEAISDVPVMEISVTSVLKDNISNGSVCNFQNLEEDVEYIRKKAEDLQSALNDVKMMSSTMKAQEGAIKCVTEAIK